MRPIKQPLYGRTYVFAPTFKLSNFYTFKLYCMKPKSILSMSLLSLLSLTTSCKHLPIQEYQSKHIRDSIYRLDSIIIKEKGDTLIIERHHYHYKDKHIKDTIHKSDTICTPYPVEVIKEVKKPLTKWQKIQLRCGRFLLFNILLLLIYLLLKSKNKCLF